MNRSNQNDPLVHPIKRKLIALAGLLPWLSACQATPATPVSQADTSMSDSDLKRKFRGIGGVSVVLLGSLTEHKFITFTTDSGRSLGAPSGSEQKTRQTSFYGGDSLSVPKTVRVVWKEGDVKNDFPRGWLGGKVVGDYTIEVARRIPQEVVDYIRSPRPGNVTGRGLRIKFRLADNGVLFGWDVEEGHKNEHGVFPHFVMAGGDFKEAVIKNGKVMTRGWYLTKEGQKIETDF